MSKPLPKWLMYRYSVLWKSLGKEIFFHNTAVKILNENKEARISVILSELKKHGWLTINLDPGDSRKRIYKLKSPEEAVNEIE